MRALPVALALLVVACGGTTETSVEIAGDLTAASPCAVPPTLFRLAKANPAYYDVFASDEAARIGVAPVIEMVGMKLAAQATPAPVQALVARQFEAFRTLYPEHTAGMMDPPRVLLVDDASVGAFAMGDPRRTEVFPWVLFINTGFLVADEVKNVPGVLESTIAHELGHLVLKNILARSSYRFYAVDGAEPFGFAQPNETAIAEAYATYQATASRMGRFLDPALGNFPFHLGSQPDPTYASYADLLVLAAVGSQPPSAECTSVATTKQALQAIIDRRLDKSDLTLPLGEDAAEAARLSAQWEADLRTCVAGLQGPLGLLVSEERRELAEQGGTPGDLDVMFPELDADDAALDAATPGNATGEHFFALAKARRAAMAKVVDARYPSLRFFTDEEEADDAAVRVAVATGTKVDMILNPYAPTYRSECTASLAAGTAPEYGGFVDAHHGLCWRYAHVTALAAKLATCR